MNKQIKVILITVVILLASNFRSLEARIGETREQCQARYGPILKIDYFGTEFEKNGIKIKVMFYKDKVIEITYRNFKGKFNEKEVLTLLELNHPKNDWIVIGKFYGIEQFEAEHIQASHITTYSLSSLSIKADEEYFKNDISGIEGL